MRRFAAIFSSVLLAFQSPVHAVRHLHPELYPHAFRDQVHHPTAAQAHAAGSMHAAVASSAVGPKQVAVIMVQFTPGNSSLISGSRSISDATKIQTYMRQMAAYYDEASYHKLTVTFKYFNSNTSTLDGDASPSGSNAGVYTLSHPEEYYGCGDEGVGCPGVSGPTTGVSANGDYLIRDALIAARTGHVSTPSHRSAGGNFDAVVVVHAGNGNETTGSTPGDIWSIFYSQETVATNGPISQAGGGWEEGDVVPETESSGITSPLGVICHEFGHELGLPDLYNTTAAGGDSVVGNWELMDSGPFDGSGANPSHPGAWDKLTLGWATPQTITSRSSGSIGYTASASGPANMLKLPVGNGTAQEYFLAEYRSRSSGAVYDKNIPGDGLLIWHVDDGITASRGVGITDPTLSNTVNTGSPHYGVSLVPADGVQISNNNQGNAGNAFTNGGVFTSPSSNNFAGQPSGITLANISGVGSGTLSFDVANLAVAAAQAIRKLINYPNPAGKGYHHPKGDNHTTLQFQLTRPAADCSLNIYTLSGDLVRKLSKADFTLNINRSTDDKWIYEYDWDLTNGDGQAVAPGVYLLLVRADGKTETAKTVVIR